VSAAQVRDVSDAAPPDDLVVASSGSGCDRIAILSFAIGAGAEALTEAESDVVRAIFEGHSNATIARARGAAVRTVANQVASVFRKLGVQSRAELVASAALMVTVRGTK
jgi:DNA-binding NarL/FixJ family response regulator